MEEKEPVVISAADIAKMTPEEIERLPKRRIVEAVASMAGSGGIGLRSPMAAQITEHMQMAVKMLMDAGVGISKHPDAYRMAQMVGKRVATGRVTPEEGMKLVGELIETTKMIDKDALG